MKKSRRSFIAKLGALSAGTGLISLAPGCANETQKQAADLDDNPKTNFKVSIFQTTDVHCQIHPHDELYWENGESVFKKAGGMLIYIHSFNKNVPKLKIHF